MNEIQVCESERETRPLPFKIHLRDGFDRSTDIGSVSGTVTPRDGSECPVCPPDVLCDTCPVISVGIVQADGSAEVEVGGYTGGHYWINLQLLGINGLAFKN